jgi:hypothetical protein
MAYFEGLFRLEGVNFIEHFADFRNNTGLGRWPVCCPVDSGRELENY